MAASSHASQLSLSLAPDSSSGRTPSSRLAPASLNLKWRSGLVNSPRHAEAIAVPKGLGSRSGKRRSQHIVGARRPAKDRDGALAQAVEKIPDDSEPDDMFMGKKLEGLEPDFWEGEQWDTLGFIVQYMWAFGILVSLVACGVSVASYNSGAVDIRDTQVFKEALDNQVDSGSFDADSFRDFPEASEAPPLE